MEVFRRVEGRALMHDASERPIRRILWTSLRVAGGLLALAAADPGAAAFQEATAVRPSALVNGDMAGVDAEGKLVGWRVPAALLEAGYAAGPESADVFAGKGAARIDSREATPTGNSFGNLLQS